MQVELCGGTNVLHSVLLGLVPWISKLSDLLEYLMLHSWPETHVFSEGARYWREIWKKQTQVSFWCCQDAKSDLGNVPRFHNLDIAIAFRGKKKDSEGLTVDAWVPFPCRQPTTGAPCYLYLDNPNYWQPNHSPHHTDLVCPVTSEKSQ